ncbi:hypothetical protein [Streptomyces sp. NPDC002328]|uniref:hypothetical protein n=1 Tax=Streptomyces sp. NPDC002328 TaxID=3364642 RepID=UPI0036D0EEC3
MPRGRHRHSPPLHRLLPPSAIAGVSLVCALGPWVFTEPNVLRGLAAAAAATAIVGAVVMRRWDIHAGKQVADLTRARAGDEWRFEERVAELESDLDESRELRIKLEQRLRAKRAELAGLRNEHAALLRRYATAETERASALEGRRLLEIESAPPANALPPARGAEGEAGTETATGTEAVGAGAVDAEEIAEDVETAAGGAEGAEASEAGAAVKGAQAAESESESESDEPETPAVFSPDGSKLFLRALSALARFDADKRAESAGAAEAAAADKSAEDAKPAAEDAKPAEAVKPVKLADTAKPGKPSGVVKPLKSVEFLKPAEPAEPAEVQPAPATSSEAGGDKEAAQEDEAKGKPEAVDEHTRVAAAHLDADPDETPAEEDPHTADASNAPDTLEAAETPRASAPVRHPSGHFTVPTAVAVAPTPQPVRPPTAEGGFDFFGTKEASASDEALEAVQNEDLADVVGQEALALHKAETEAEFKPADEETRGVGQVIDLTAHDETEQIDLHRLRSAVS